MPKVTFTSESTPVSPGSPRKGGLSKANGRNVIPQAQEAVKTMGKWPGRTARGSLVTKVLAAQAKGGGAERIVSHTPSENALTSAEAQTPIAEAEKGVEKITEPLTDEPANGPTKHVAKPQLGAKDKEGAAADKSDEGVAAPNEQAHFEPQQATSVLMPADGADECAETGREMAREIVAQDIPADSAASKDMKGGIVGLLVPGGDEAASKYIAKPEPPGGGEAAENTAVATAASVGEAFGKEPAVAGAGISSAGAADASSGAAVADSATAGSTGCQAAKQQELTPKPSSETPSTTAVSFKRTEGEPMDTPVAEDAEGVRCSSTAGTTGGSVGSRKSTSATDIRAPTNLTQMPRKPSVAGSSGARAVGAAAAFAAAVLNGPQRPIERRRSLVTASPRNNQAAMTSHYTRRASVAVGTGKQRQSTPTRRVSASDVSGAAGGSARRPFVAGGKDLAAGGWKALPAVRRPSLKVSGASTVKTAERADAGTAGSGGVIENRGGMPEGDGTAAIGSGLAAAKDSQKSGSDDAPATPSTANARQNINSGELLQPTPRRPSLAVPASFIVGQRNSDGTRHSGVSGTAADAGTKSLQSSAGPEAAAADATDARRRRSVAMMAMTDGMRAALDGSSVADIAAAAADGGGGGGGGRNGRGSTEELRDDAAALSLEDSPAATEAELEKLARMMTKAKERGLPTVTLFGNFVSPTAASTSASPPTEGERRPGNGRSSSGSISGKITVEPAVIAAATVATAAGEEMVTAASFEKGLSAVGFSVSAEEAAGMFIAIWRHVSGGNGSGDSTSVGGIDSGARTSGQLPLAAFAAWCLDIPSVAWKAERRRRVSLMRQQRQLAAAAGGGSGSGGVSSPRYSALDLAATVLGDLQRHLRGSTKGAAAPLLLLGSCFFVGRKSFWRTKEDMDVALYENTSLGAIIVCYRNIADGDNAPEMPPLVLDAARVATAAANVAATAAASRTSGSGGGIARTYKRSGSNATNAAETAAMVASGIAAAAAATTIPLDGMARIPASTCATVSPHPSAVAGVRERHAVIAEYLLARLHMPPRPSGVHSRSSGMHPSVQLGESSASSSALMERKIDAGITGPKASPRSSRGDTDAAAAAATAAAAGGGKGSGDAAEVLPPRFMQVLNLLGDTWDTLLLPVPALYQTMAATVGAAGAAVSGTIVATGVNYSTGSFSSGAAAATPAGGSAAEAARAAPAAGAAAAHSAAATAASAAPSWPAFAERHAWPKRLIVEKGQYESRAAELHSNLGQSRRFSAQAIAHNDLAAAAAAAVAAAAGEDTHDVDIPAGAAVAAAADAGAARERELLYKMHSAVAVAEKMAKRMSIDANAATAGGGTAPTPAAAVAAAAAAVAAGAAATSADPEVSGAKHAAPESPRKAVPRQASMAVGRAPPGGR